MIGRVVVLLACGLALLGCAGRAEPSTEEHDAPAAAVPSRVAALPGHVVDTLGVASFNVYRHLGREDAMADALRLTDDERVDVIGWQETRADYFPDVERRIERRGWDTWQLWEPDGPFWLAVSWRRDLFSFVEGSWTEAHGGGGKGRTDSPFPPRGWIVVTLRHRETGRLLTVVDTHLNQAIESGDGFQDTLNAEYAKEHLRLLAGVWDEVPGDLVVGTGDYNFDFRDDFAARPAGGIWDTQHEHATSSYQVLGLDGVEPSRSGRWIDYVFIANDDLRVEAEDDGTGQFVQHRTLDGYGSDHRPLVTRIRWYER